MSTEKRLSNVFKNAETVSFDKNSKFILFSDCHRGDNSWADDFAHNEQLFFYALDYYYKKGFTYIEIGDGDELWENKRFNEIRKTHSHIFWMMRKFYEKKCFYFIWGNHNMKWKKQKNVEKYLYRFFNERENCYEPLFDNIKVHEGLILQDSNSQQKIFLFHGHQGDLMCDYLWKISSSFLRHIWKPLQLFGVHDPTSPAKNYKKCIITEKKIMEWVDSNKQTVICGHTHRPMFPSNGKASYFNTGSCVHPRCITGIEIIDAEIRLIKWCIKTRDNGSLFIGREILAGPRNIYDFL